MSRRVQVRPISVTWCLNLHLSRVLTETETELHLTTEETETEKPEQGQRCLFCPSFDNSWFEDNMLTGVEDLINQRIGIQFCMDAVKSFDKKTIQHFLKTLWWFLFLKKLCLKALSGKD